MINKIKKIHYLWEGFVKSKKDEPKAPSFDPANYKNSLVDIEKASTFDSFIGHLNQDVLMVDIDNKNNGVYDEKKLLSSKMSELLIKCKYFKTDIIETTHGTHYYFKVPKDLPFKSSSNFNGNGILTLSGIVIDLKNGNQKNGWDALKVENVYRDVIHTHTEVNGIDTEKEEKPFFSLSFSPSFPFSCQCISI